MPLYCAPSSSVVHGSSIPRSIWTIWWPCSISLISTLCGHGRPYRGHVHRCHAGSPHARRHDPSPGANARCGGGVENGFTASRACRLRYQGSLRTATSGRLCPLSNGYLPTLVTTIVMGVGIGVLAQPQLSVRFLAERSINRAVSVEVLPPDDDRRGLHRRTSDQCLVLERTGQVAYYAADKNADNIIPLYINSAMPDLFVIIFLLVLLAAGMSTLSSIFHHGTTAG